MSPVPELSSGWSLLLVALGAVILALSLWGASAALRLAPVARRWRELLMRVAPLAGMTTAVLYVFAAASWLFGKKSALSPEVSAVLLAALAFVSWPLLRDLFSGVAVKAGRVCQVGDNVETERAKGRVTRMGLRVLTLETSQGEEAIVPYTEVARAAVRRRPVLEGVSLHVFRVQARKGLSRVEIEQRVREAALLCHWASVVRPPEVSVSAEGTLDVTVFALDARYAPLLETAVRQSVE